MSCNIKDMKMNGIYMVGGYPDMQHFRECLKMACDAKIDFIETGIPFNDPVADGPVISEALNYMSSKTSVDEIMGILKKESSIKKYIMTYSNVIYNYGTKRFSTNFSSYLDGIIIPDLPNRMHNFFYSTGFEIPIIPFVTPESTNKDIMALKNCKGDFIYFISVRGITGGTLNADVKNFEDKINKIRDISGKKVIMGFGIKSKADIKKVYETADGAIIGTEVVKRQWDPSSLQSYLTELFA